MLPEPISSQRSGRDLVCVELSWLVERDQYIFHFLYHCLCDLYYLRRVTFPSRSFIKRWASCDVTILSHSNQLKTSKRSKVTHSNDTSLRGSGAPSHSLSNNSSTEPRVHAWKPLQAFHSVEVRNQHGREIEEEFKGTLWDWRRPTAVRWDASRQGNHRLRHI